MAELDYNAVGALTDVRRFEWDDTDELYNLIAQSQYQYNARNQITITILFLTAIYTTLTGTSRNIQIPLTVPFCTITTSWVN